MKYLLTTLLFTTLLLGCKKDPALLDDSLFGRWEVTKVSGQIIDNGTPGLVVNDNSPTGFVRFDDNGKGEQNYSFVLLGTTYPNTGNFSWTANPAEIRIQQFRKPDLIWRRKLAEPNKQEATYAIVISPTQTIDYTLTLTR
jgi:hypothetical protein